MATPVAAASWEQLFTTLETLVQAAVGSKTIVRWQYRPEKRLKQSGALIELRVLSDKDNGYISRDNEQGEAGAELSTDWFATKTITVGVAAYSLIQDSRYFPFAMLSRIRQYLQRADIRAVLAANCLGIVDTEQEATPEAPEIVDFRDAATASFPLVLSAQVLAEFAENEDAPEKETFTFIESTIVRGPYNGFDAGFSPGFA